MWERGAGLTRACGTAACAAVVAAARLDLTGRRRHVQLPGGELAIDWSDNDHILMTGPFAHDFDGEIPARLVARLRMSGLEVLTFGCRLNLLRIGSRAPERASKPACATP